MLNFLFNLFKEDRCNLEIVLLVGLEFNIYFHKFLLNQLIN